MVSNNLENFRVCAKQTRTAIHRRSVLLFISCVLFVLLISFHNFIWMSLFGHGNLVFQFVTFARGLKKPLSYFFEVFNFMSICVVIYLISFSTIFFTHIYHYLISLLELTTTKILSNIETEDQDVIYQNLKELLEFIDVFYM